MGSRIRFGFALSLTLAGSILVLVACGSDVAKSEFDPGGDGPDANTVDRTGSSSGFSDGGSVDASDASTPEPGTLEATIRDFKKYDPDAGAGATNPDFENIPSEDEPPQGKSAPYFGPWAEATPAYFPGADYPIDIVMPTLGADGKPQYNTAAKFDGVTGRTATTHGEAFFDQWYHDTPGVNVVRKITIQMTKDANGVYSYDSAVSGVPLSPSDPSKNFFPIDDGTPGSTEADGFGNQGNPHNYHFTVEIHTRFTYRGDETFKFSGDDDVFVFINKKLVINIGGIHAALSKEVKLPDVAASLGLVVGQEYPLDFFQAERHVTQSNLRIDTTIDLVPSVVH